MPRGGVQFYDHQTKSYQHPQSHKIKRILEEGCLKRVHEDLWQCFPILGYNTSTYDLTRNSAGGFNCNCQGFHKNRNCSHLEALRTRLFEETDQKQGSLF